MLLLLRCSLGACPETQVLSIVTLGSKNGTGGFFPKVPPPPPLSPSPPPPLHRLPVLVLQNFCRSCISVPESSSLQQLRLISLHPRTLSDVELRVQECFPRPFRQHTASDWHAVRRDSAKSYLYLDTESIAAYRNHL